MARVRAEENAGSDLSFFENWRMFGLFFQRCHVDFKSENFSILRLYSLD